MLRLSFCLFTLASLPVSALADAVPSKEAAEGTFAERPFSPYANRSFPERPLWGDTHLHTGLSLDAGAFGNTCCPMMRGGSPRASRSFPRPANPSDWPDRWTGWC